MQADRIQGHTHTHTGVQKEGTFLKGAADVKQYGIAKYNARCRGIVMRCASVRVCVCVRVRVRACIYMCVAEVERLTCGCMCVAEVERLTCGCMCVAGVEGDDDAARSLDRL